MKKRLRNKLAPIKAIVFDFDGVMTDNTVIVDQDGKESVAVSRADGLGIDLLRNRGFDLLILSSESNPVVGARAKKLKMKVIQGAAKKETVLMSYAAEHSLRLDQILYVGNDLNDLAVMKIVGCSAVPADAHKCVKSIADIQLKTKGGKGVVRELADLMEKLRRNGV